MKAFLLILLLTLSIVLAASVNLDDLDVVKFTLTEGSERTLRFDSQDYKINPESVSSSEVKLSFPPSDLIVTLKKTEPLSIDLNKDQKEDFTLTYLENVEKTATLEARKIELLPKTTTSETPKTPTTQPQTQLPTQITTILSLFKSNLKLIIGGIVVLIILILIVRAFRRKPHPEKLYKKAEDLHREAQEFFEDGDEETASELYEKAEETREKARDQENLHKEV